MAKGSHHVTDDQATLATASAVALPEGQAPEWVKLFPYGTIRGRDGRGPYKVRDPDHARQIIAATVAYQGGADNPVDYDHQTQRAEKNGIPAPAAGWFKQFEARADGIWARSDWTTRAAQHLVDKEFRYISPTFMHTQDGTVLRIVGAGLTNMPNLDIPAIASQQNTGDPMDLLKLMREAMALSEAASAEAIATHCQQLTTGARAVAKLLGLPDTTPPDQLATAAQSAIAALATALNVGGDTTIPALATAAQQIGAQLATANQGNTQVDLTKYVPMDVHLAVASQFSSLQKTTATDAAESAVEDAIKAGKVTPALKGWALAMANQSLAAFQQYVDKAPVLVTASQQQTTTVAPPGTLATGVQGKLTAEELAVASQLGQPPELYLKTKGDA